MGAPRRVPARRAARRADWLVGRDGYRGHPRPAGWNLQAAGDLDDSMSTEARATIRGVGLLAVQRGFHVVAGVIFAMFVPRLMGPDTFGRYALVTSVSLWFALMTG